MPLTDSAVAVTKALKALVDDRPDLGFAATHYGDTDLLPEFPVALFESGPKVRPLESSSARRFVVELSVLITIIHGKVQDVGTTKEETEAFAEEVEKVLHEDHTLGDLVVWGHVTRMDPGVVVKRSAVLRATRLSWDATSRQTF